MRPAPDRGADIRECAVHIIDTEAHLREGCCLGEVYDLDGEFAAFTPERVANRAKSEREY